MDKIEEIKARFYLYDGFYGCDVIEAIDRAVAIVREEQAALLRDRWNDEAVNIAFAKAANIRDAFGNQPSYRERALIIEALNQFRDDLSPIAMPDRHVTTNIDINFAAMSAHYSNMISAKRPAMSPIAKPDEADDEIEQLHVICEPCGKRVPIDEAEDAYSDTGPVCHECAESRRQEVAKCDHIWEPGEADFGPGKVCTRCLDFVRDEPAAPPSADTETAAQIIEFGVCNDIPTAYIIGRLEVAGHLRRAAGREQFSPSASRITVTRDEIKILSDWIGSPIGHSPIDVAEFIDGLLGDRVRIES